MTPEGPQRDKNQDGSPEGRSDANLPQIPSHVKDPKHIAYLRKCARDVMSMVLAKWEIRGPDDSAGSLLTDFACARFGDIFDDHIFPQLLPRRESEDVGDSYSDSYQHLALAGSDEEWKQDDDDGSDVSGDWYFDPKYEHLEPIVLAGAALSDGGHTLFVALYDEGRKSLILPTSGPDDYDFLSPCIESKNALLGLIVSISHDGMDYLFEGSDVYIAPEIVEFELANIAYGEPSPYLKLLVGQLPIWEDGFPDDYMISRSKILPGGEVEAFVMLTGEKPIENPEGESAVSTGERVDLGAIWCKVGPKDGITTEILDYVYYPPTLSKAQKMLYQRLYPEEVDAQVWNGVPGREAPAAERSDGETESDVPATPPDYTPMEQVEVYFQNKKFSRITDLKAYPDIEGPSIAISRALDFLREIFPLKLPQDGSLSLVLFGDGDGSFVIGFPNSYLRDQYCAECDHIYIRATIGKDNIVACNFYGISIQDTPYITSVLKLLEDPRVSILTPMLFGRLSESFTANSKDSSDIFQDLVCSIGFRDLDMYDSENQTETAILFARPEREQLMLLRRHRDGGMIVFEESDVSDIAPLGSVEWEGESDRASFWAERDEGSESAD